MIDKQKLLMQKEKEILAALFSNPENISKIKFQIPVESFSKLHKSIFAELYEKENFDSLAILHTLKKHDYFYQREILDLASMPSNLNLRIAEFYDIKDSINAENILKISLKKAKGSLKGLDLISDTIEQLKTEMKKYSRFEQPKTFADNVADYLQEIENEIKGSTYLIKTKNYPSFNDFTGGISESNLIGIAGAFKNGKTTFALNLILDFVSQGIPSAIFSLEMTRKEVIEKILSMELTIPYELLRNPKKLNDTQRANLMRATKNFSNRKLFFFDNLLLFNEIESMTRKLAENENVKIILIDYIGLIKSSFKYKSIESREREISMLSNSLKILAKETKTVIIVISQLNRSGYKEASSINLAESIGLARDSDFLFTIFNPSLAGLEKIKFGLTEIPVKENYYVVKLDSSRHSQSGRNFVLGMNECGLMKELDLKHSCIFDGANSTNGKNKEIVKNVFNEVETPF